jgi:hypothetical protein
VPAPTFGAAGTYLNGATSGTANVPAPAGLVAGSSVVLVFIYKETTAAVTTIPTGFTEITPPPQIPSGTGLQTLHAFWKVATASEPATYNFAFGSTWRDAVAVRIDGGNTTSPIDVFTTGIKNSSAGTAGPSLSVTTTGADELLLWASANWNGGSWSGLTGFTANVNSGATGVFTKPQAVAGASGAVQGTTSSTSSNYMTAWLLALRPAQTVANVSGSDSAGGTDSAALGQRYAASDSATGSDTASYAIPFGSSDAGSSSDSVSGLRANVTGPEQGAGGESLGINATVTATPNTGTGSEAAKIGVRGTDSATKQDQLVSLVGNTSAANPGVGADGATVETLFGDLVISLWAVHPTSGALVALPDFTRVTLSPQRNSAGSVTVDYPSTGLNFDLLRNTVTGDRDLEVEIWSIGSTTRALRGYLQEASGDDVAEGKTWTFAGGFLELRMGEAIVFPQPLVGVPSLGEEVQVDHGSIPQAKWDQLIALGYTGRANDGAERLYVPQLVLDAVLAGTTVPVLADPKRELKFAAVTPGELVGAIMTQARSRGTLTDIEWDFTATRDSEGNTWPKVLTTKFSPGAGYDQILDKLVDLGLAEWAVEWDSAQQRKVLRLWTPEGRGTDLTVGNRPVVLRRGRNLLEAPRKWSVRDAGTSVLAAGAEGFYETASDASAVARRGRRIERAVSANNIADEDSVSAYAQAQLSVTTPGLLEVTHGLGFLPGEPRPLIAFDVGDWVYSQTGTSMDRLRVVQWTLTVDAKSNPSGTVTLNDTVQDALVRLQKRLTALQSGETVVGTSEPSEQQEDTVPPAAPTGLVADSLAYRQDVTGDTYASVTLGWAEVTINVDGTAATDVAGYRIRYKPANIPFVDAYGNPLGNDDAWSVLTYTPRTPPYTFSGVAPDTDIDIQVAAFDNSGNQGPWSTNLIHHTASDDTPPPSPSAPVVEDWFGTLKVTWDGLDVNGADMWAAAPDFDHVEIHVSAGNNFTPDDTTLSASMFAAGTWNITDLPIGTTQFVRLVAVDKSVNKSAPSAVGSATPRGITYPDMGEDAVGSAQIRDLAVLTAHVGDAQIVDAKINTISVGKLTAGTLSADVLLSGNIRTATTGARSEMDGAGIRLYNAAGNQTVNFAAATGAATITGEYRTQFTGTRLVFNAGGVQPDEIWFYPSSGSAYAVLSSHNHNGAVTQGAINMRGNSTRSDGYTGHVGAWPPEAYIKWGLLQGVSVSAVSCGQSLSTYWAPSIVLEADWRNSNDGGARRIEFRHRASDGGIRGGSVLHYRESSSGEAMLHNTGANLALTWSFNSGIGIYVGNLAGAGAAITAADFKPASSQTTKKNIRAASFGSKKAAALDVVKAVESKSWNYDWEPTEAPRKRKTVVRDMQRGPDGIVVSRDGEPPAVEVVEVDMPDEAVVAPHTFPLAEELRAVAPELVTDAPDVPGGLTVSLRDTVGLLWQAVKELNAKVDALPGGGPKITK